MLTLKIKDFQSIKEAQVKVSGFTVLVGRSNLGKSALVRAFRAATSNAPGDSFVRHGAKYSEVQIDGPDFTIEWRKGSGYNDFKVNGEDFYSVGAGGVPQPIIDLGFKKLSLLGGKEELEVQVTDQFQPLFLLDAPGSVSAAALADAERADQLRLCQELAEKKRRDVRSEKKVREKDLDQVVKDLATLEGLHLDELELKISSLSRDYESSLVALNTLKAYKDRLQTLDFNIQSLDRVISSLPYLANTDDLNQLCAEITFMQRLDNTRRNSQLIIEKYQKVELVPNLPDMFDAFNVKDNLDNLHTLKARHDKLSNVISRITSITNQLKDGDLNLKPCDDLIQTLSSTHAIHSNYKKLQAELKAGISELNELKALQNDLDVKIKEEELKLSVCSECGQPLPH